MPEIPIKVTGSLNIEAICSACHEPLEITVIIDNEKSLVVVSLDSGHKCKSTSPVRKQPSLN